MRIRSLLIAATAAGMAYRYLNNKGIKAADTEKEPQTAFAFDQDQDQAESGASAGVADSLNPAEHLSGQGLQGSDGFRNASSEGGRGTIPGMVDFTRGA